ncbi:MAG TPA: porin family protein [Bacteroidota bacterium]
MKRSSIALCIIFACTAFFAAQAMAQMEFGVGPIVGVNFGTASISPTPVYPTGYTQGGRTGMKFGAQAELGFAKMFYVEMEPSFIGKGYSINGPQGSATVSVSELQFPVLFKVKFMKGVIRPYAFAGPNIGFVLASTLSYSITGQTIPDQDLKSQTSSTDFAIDFGGGAEYNVTPKIGITLDVRYSLGVGNLANPPATPGQVATTSQTNHASGFQILAGVMFHII